MKKVMILVAVLISFTVLIIKAETKNCGYSQEVDGNIDHYQSTGCTPFLEPFDCKVIVEFQGPPPNVTCLNGNKIDINISTEIQIDDDLYQSQPINSTNGVSCSGGIITKIIYTKSGRVLTPEDSQKAGLCP